MLAVVMSVKNEEDYISEAIESVLKQSYQNFKLYIIDDASIDNTVSLIRNFNDARIFLYQRSVSCGLGQNLKFLCSKVDEPYIARMDGDDVCEPHRFDTQLRYMVAEGYDLLGSRYSSITTSGEVVGSSMYLDDVECKIYLNYKSTIGHPTVMMKRESYLRTGGYSGISPASDYDLLTRFCACGLKIGMVDEALLRFRFKPSSTGNLLGYEQRIAFNHIRQCWKENKIPNPNFVDSRRMSLWFRLQKFLHRKAFAEKVKSDFYRMDGRYIISLIYVLKSSLISPLQFQYYLRIFMYRLRRFLYRKFKIVGD